MVFGRLKGKSKFVYFCYEDDECDYKTEKYWNYVDHLKKKHNTVDWETEDWY